MTETRTASRATEAHSAIYAKGFAALHIFTGLVWLTNGLAKVFNKGSYDLGFRSFSLISRDGAMPIAHRASDATQIDSSSPATATSSSRTGGPFGIFLTIAELAIGLRLIFGFLTILTPIWITLWPTGGYFWEYPAEDLWLLRLLAIVPGRAQLGASIAVSRPG